MYMLHAQQHVHAHVHVHVCGVSQAKVPFACLTSPTRARMTRRAHLPPRNDKNTHQGDCAHTPHDTGEAEGDEMGSGHGSGHGSGLVCTDAEVLIPHGVKPHMTDGHPLHQRFERGVYYKPYR